jgi:hypothetical protein
VLRGLCLRERTRPLVPHHVPHSPLKMAAAPPIALKRLDVLDELEAAFDRGVKKARGAGRYSAPQRAALGAVLGAVKAAVFLEIRRHCEADQPGESAERPV